MSDMTDSSSVGKTTESAGYPAAGYGWYVIVILYLCYTFSFVDRAIITYLVEPIKADLLINDTYFSLLSGLSFVAFYAFMGIPVGRLADARSRRNLLLAGVTLWSTMTILCGQASTFWQLFFTRMGVGVGEACLYWPIVPVKSDCPALEQAFLGPGAVFRLRTRSLAHDAQAPVTRHACAEPGYDSLALRRVESRTTLEIEQE